MMRFDAFGPFCVDALVDFGSGVQAYCYPSHVNIFDVQKIELLIVEKAIFAYVAIHEGKPQSNRNLLAKRFSCHSGRT